MPSLPPRGEVQQTGAPRTLVGVYIVAPVDRKEPNGPPATSGAGHRAVDAVGNFGTRKATEPGGEPQHGPAVARDDNVARFPAATQQAAGGDKAGGLGSLCGGAARERNGLSPDPGA